MGGQELRVGVTGHRALADTARLEASVDGVLDELDRLDAASRGVISSLAEGADRLVAHRALARTGWSLAVVLPLEPDDYATDFTTDASRAEFRTLLAGATAVELVPAQPSRDHAYLAAGLRVAATSDVMIALWNGQPARGRGGTAEVVMHVRADGIPLVWVHTGDGAVTKERWPWAS